MKTTEAWSAGIFPHLYAWNDHDQIASNRVKWRAAVEQLGDKWAFLIVKERIPDPTPADREKVRDLPVRKASK